MEEKEELYELDLHEGMLEATADFQITRVPGGWIYHGWEELAETGLAVFVPFNDEFNPNKLNKTYGKQKP